MRTLSQPFVLFATTLVAAVYALYALEIAALAGAWPPLVAATIGALASLWLARRRATAETPAVAAAAALVAVALVGLHERPVAAHVALVEWLGDARHDVVARGTVVSAPTPSPRGWSFTLDLEATDDRAWHGRGARPPRAHLFYPFAVAAEADEVAAPGTPPTPLPLPGDRIEAFVRLERFEPPDVPGELGIGALMEGRGLVARATVREPHVVVGQLGGPRVALERRLAARRLSLERAIGCALPIEQAALATAMITASRGLIDDTFRVAFDTTGTSHLLAISGLHLGVLAMLLWWFFGHLANRAPALLARFGRRRVCGPATLVALTLYVLAIGAPVSAVRALAMVAAATAAVSMLRPLCTLHTLALAALVLVGAQPSVVLEPGFQLSLSATLAILVFLRCRPRRADASRSRHRLHRLATFFGVSLSATLSTFPVIVRMTGELPLAGTWLNLLVVPLVSSVLFPLMLVGALLVTTPLAPLGVLLLDLGSAGLVHAHHLLDLAAFTPGATLRPGLPAPLPWLLLTLASATAIVGAFRPRAALAAAALFALALAPPLLTRPRGVHTPPDAVRVHFIPVGQGDATLLTFPSGHTALIDGGGRPMGRDPGLWRVAPYLKRLGIRRLDAVILTHADHDHMGGLFALVRPFAPRHFVYDALDPSPELARLVAEMRRAGTTLHPVAHHHRLFAGDHTLDVVRPALEGAGKNDTSLVTTLHAHGATVVLPGDIEAPAEAWWLESGHAHRATVLKMPHHGSRTSSTPALLDALAPRIAVASSGRHNHFGHPHPAVVDRYLARGTHVWRTDENGLVLVDITRTGRIDVRTMR